MCFSNGHLNGNQPAMGAALSKFVGKSGTASGGASPQAAPASGGGARPADASSGTASGGRAIPAVMGAAAAALNQRQRQPTVLAAPTAGTKTKLGN